MSWVPEARDIERYQNDPLFRAQVSTVVNLLTEEGLGGDRIKLSWLDLDNLAMAICAALYPFEEWLKRDADVKAEIERLKHAAWRRPAT